MQDTTITKADSGLRLDRWLQKHYPQLPFNELQRLVRKKLLKVDGAKATLKQVLEAGQILRHPEFDNTPEKAESALPPKPRWLEEAVLYEDDQILILNKPAGLATQGGSGQTRHVDGYLPHLQRDYDSPPRLVHRLDKDTSGILVLARTLQASRLLVKAFASHQIEKTYLALCANMPVPSSGQIDAPLMTIFAGGEEKMAVDLEYESLGDTKSATTRYRVREHFGKRLSVVELFPQTGRKHQLRVHMAYIGCPIIGDGKYGGQQAHPQGENLSKKLHLHASEILIPAEILGKEVTLTAPLPQHFTESLKHIGADF